MCRLSKLYNDMSLWYAFGIGNRYLAEMQACLENACGEPVCVKGCPNRAIVYKERWADETVCYHWVGCIESIRSKDKNTKIAVVSKKNYPVYCWSLISYYFRRKNRSWKDLFPFWMLLCRNGCQVIYGKTSYKNWVWKKDGCSVRGRLHTVFFFVRCCRSFPFYFFFCRILYGWKPLFRYASGWYYGPWKGDYAWIQRAYYRSGLIGLQCERGCSAGWRAIQSVTWQIRFLPAFLTEYCFCGTKVS